MKSCDSEKGKKIKEKKEKAFVKEFTSKDKVIDVSKQCHRLRTLSP